MIALSPMRQYMEFPIITERRCNYDLRTLHHKRNRGKEESLAIGFAKLLHAKNDRANSPGNSEGPRHRLVDVPRRRTAPAPPLSVSSRRGHPYSKIVVEPCLFVPLTPSFHVELIV